MLSVWTTQKYALSENTAPKKQKINLKKKIPSGWKIHLCLSLLNGRGDIRKKCWLETEFFILASSSVCNNQILFHHPSFRDIILLFLGKRQGEIMINFCTVDVDKRSLTHYWSIHYHMGSVEQPDICSPAAAKDFWWIRLRSLFIGNWKGPWSFHSGYWNSLPASKTPKGHIWKQLFPLDCSGASSWRQLAGGEELLLGWENLQQFTKGLEIHPLWKDKNGKQR